MLNHSSHGCLKECPKPRSAHSSAQKMLADPHRIQPKLPGMVSSSVSHTFACPHPSGHTLYSQQTAPCSRGRPFPMCLPLLRCCPPLVPWPQLSSWQPYPFIIPWVRINLSLFCLLRHDSKASLCFALTPTYLYAFPTLARWPTALRDYL